MLGTRTDVLDELLDEVLDNMLLHKTVGVAGMSAFASRSLSAASSSFARLLCIEVYSLCFSLSFLVGGFPNLVSFPSFRV